MIDKNDLLEIEIESGIRRIEELLRTNVFNFKEKDFSGIKQKSLAMKKLNNPFRNSAMIEILINLRNLMYKCEHICKKRIDFDDNIVKMEYEVENIKTKRVEKIKIKDITDVVKYMRDAVCHIEDNNKRWLTPSIFLSAGFLINNNDVCFCIGKQELFINKGIVRALEETKKILAKYLIRYHRVNDQIEFSNRITAYARAIMKKGRENKAAISSYSS